VKFLYRDDSSTAVRIFDNDRRLRFDAVVGALPPLPKDITIYGLRSDRWVASVTTSGGGNWVVLDPPAGNFTSLTDIQIGVDSTQLPEGSYTARITFSVEGHPGPPATVDIDLGVAKTVSPSELPTFVPQGVVNGANLLTQSMAPGGLFTIFGTNLATTTATADQFPLPTNLGGTEVVVNGFRAPLLYVSPGQLNAQVPAEIFEGAGGVIVRTGLGQTLTIPMTLQAAAPQLFLTNGVHAVVLNQDNKVNTPTRPAAGGSKISIFFSGQGPVNPPVASGQPAPFKPLARVTLPAQVEIAGRTTEILYMGLTPGFAGLAQTDVRVPEGIRGELAVRITIGDSTSNIGYVSVQ
jgi:uncharacterized protein (TIGR03437 family)